VLLSVAVVAVRLEIPKTPGVAGAWISDSSRRHAVLFALALVPFAGIAFLWFIGVVRDRVGEAEDRFFATVFLGSGLLFIAMLFASTATASGLVATVGQAGGPVAPGVWSTGRQVSHDFLDIAMRMAAVFIMAGSTILHRTQTGPRWLATLGYAIAAAVMVLINFLGWLGLLFPLWVLVLSVHMLVAGFTRIEPAGS